MDKITNQIYIGNWKEVRIADVLEANGITSILNVAHDHEDKPMDGFIFFKAGMVDGDWPNNSCSGIAAIKILDWLIRSGNVVFVHCINGFNRAPFIVSYFLALARKSSWKKEFENIYRIRTTVSTKPWMSDLAEIFKGEKII